MFLDCAAALLFGIVDSTPPIWTRRLLKFYLFLECAAGLLLDIVDITPQNQKRRHAFARQSIIGGRLLRGPMIPTAGDNY